MNAAIPGRTTQLAVNAGNDCLRVRNHLTTVCSAAGLVQAEAARQRALTALRDLGPMIRAAKAELRGRA